MTRLLMVVLLGLAVGVPVRADDVLIPTPGDAAIPAPGKAATKSNPTPCDCGPGCKCDPCQCGPKAVSRTPADSAVKVACGVGIGSGTVIWSENGHSLILTNRHVAVNLGRGGGDPQGLHIRATGGRTARGVTSWTSSGYRLPCRPWRSPTRTRGPGHVRHWGLPPVGYWGRSPGRPRRAGEASLTGTFPPYLGDSGAGLFAGCAGRGELGIGYRGDRSGSLCAVPVSALWDHMDTVVARPAFPRLRAVIDRLKARGKVRMLPPQAAAVNSPAVGFPHRL